MKLPALEWNTSVTYTRIQSAAAVPRMRQPPLTMRPPTAIEVFSNIWRPRASRSFDSFRIYWPTIGVQQEGLFAAFKRELSPPDDEQGGVLCFFCYLSVC